MSTFIKLDVIRQDVTMTAWMRACGLFGNGKIIGHMETMKIEYKEREEVTFERCQRLIDNMAYNMSEQVKFVFIHLNYININGDIVPNAELHCKPYIDKAVREVSDGKHSFVFARFLEQQGIPVEVTATMFIK